MLTCYRIENYITQIEFQAINNNRMEQPIEHLESWRLQHGQHGAKVQHSRQQPENPCLLSTSMAGCWTDIILLYILLQLTRRGACSMIFLHLYHLSVSCFFSQHDPIQPSNHQIIQSSNHICRLSWQTHFRLRRSSLCDAKIIKKAWFLMPHVATHLRIQNIHFS